MIIKITSSDLPYDTLKGDLSALHGQFRCGYSLYNRAGVDGSYYVEIDDVRAALRLGERLRQLGVASEPVESVPGHPLLDGAIGLLLFTGIKPPASRDGKK